MAYSCPLKTFTLHITTRLQQPCKAFFYVIMKSQYATLREH